MSQKFDVVTAGAGLSGLLSASLLSMKGLKVCLLEKNAEIGGMIQPYRRKGYFFETGMNIFGAYKKGQIQRDLFSLFGVPEDTDITDIPAFEFISDNKKYIIPNNRRDMFDVFAGYFPEETDALNKFFGVIDEVSDALASKNFYGGSAFKKYFGQGAEDFILSITDNPDLRDLLRYNALLSGYNVRTTSLYVYAAVTGSFSLSAGMFTGGTKKFIEILRKNILENGGEILTGKEVVKFDTEKNTVKRCICKDGSSYEGKMFLSSIHPKNFLNITNSKIIKSFYRKRIMQLPETKSSFIVNIILKPDSLLFAAKPVFINKGNKRIMFYTPASGRNGKFAGVAKIMSDDDYRLYKKWYMSKTGKRGKDYEEFKKQKAEDLIAFTEKEYPEFKGKTVGFNAATPLTFRDYTGTPEGSSYGIEHDFNNPELSLIPNNTKFKNLFLTGQSLNFHGMLGVSVTSVNACSLVLKEKLF